MDVSVTEMSGTTVSGPASSGVPKQAIGFHRSEQSSGSDRSPVGHEELRQMVEQMQDQLDSMNVSLQYSFYGADGEKVAVQVVNRVTGQVIREIPSKEMQILQTKMSELVGMIFNDNA
ncbi:MAG: flagellar protein FlaG [Deltaproteobacteria bacterium]|nr:flagellar protein FlaG [Deltaproteobacteria bacterium]